MRVNHITPGSSDKNFGKAINTIIEGLPDDDWICLRDIDTMPLHHRVFFKQCEEIAERGDFDLVGCMTNRQGLKYQLHDGKLSENFDVKHHVKIAHERYEKHGSEVEEIPKGLIAGIMMLFSKKTWFEVGKFPEGGIQIKGCFIDYLFCKILKDNDYRIGIAPGIYVFHLYREWSENVRLKNEHLY
jgi:hypothetical protein